MWLWRVESCGILHRGVTWSHLFQITQAVMCWLHWVGKDPQGDQSGTFAMVQVTEEGGQNQGSGYGDGEGWVDLRDQGSGICWTGNWLDDTSRVRSQDIGGGVGNESSLWK